MNKPFFLKQFFRDFKHTGAVCPSSKTLTDKMLKRVNFSKPIHILELGPGTGCMTGEILSRMGSSSKLSCIEINPEFCQKLKTLEKDPRFSLYEASATDFNKLIGDQPVDYVISGLPLANFKKSEIKSIFDQVESVLTPEGLFIQFQYTTKLDKLFKARFGNVLKNFAFFNMPPAFVYSCSF